MKKATQKRFNWIDLYLHMRKSQPVYAHIAISRRVCLVRHGPQLSELKRNIFVFVWSAYCKPIWSSAAKSNEDWRNNGDKRTKDRKRETTNAADMREKNCNCIHSKHFPLIDLCFRMFQASLYAEGGSICSCLHPVPYLKLSSTLLALLDFHRRMRVVHLPIIRSPR